MDETYRESLHRLWGAATDLPSYDKSKWFDLETCLWVRCAGRDSRVLDELHSNYPDLRSEPYVADWNVLADALGITLGDGA